MLSLSTVVYTGPTGETRVLMFFTRADPTDYIKPRTLISPGMNTSAKSPVQLCTTV
jgi:hypothetical protein